MALRHEASPVVGAAASVHLLGGFELLTDGRTVDVPLGTQRLLAFLALRERPVLRSHVAGSLWPDTREPKAAASLRSALWRANALSAGIVDANATHVRLEPSVRVDVREAVVQGPRARRRRADRRDTRRDRAGRRAAPRLVRRLGDGRA